MHLVGRHGSVEGGLAFTLTHPCSVAPLVARGIMDYGGGAGELLGPKGEGIGFQRKEVPVRASDLIFVQGALAHLRDEDLPHPNPWMLAHDVPSSVPEVEIPDHRDAPGVRGPHGEARTCDAFELYRVRPELFVEPEVVALAEEVKVLLAEDGRKPVGIFDLGLAATLPRDQQTVGHHLRDGSGEEAIRVDALQLAQSIAIVGEDLHGARPRQEDPYQEAIFLCRVHPEEREGVWMVACYHGGYRVFVLQDASSAVSPRRSRTPLIGMPTQSGRLSSS